MLDVESTCACGFTPPDSGRFRIARLPSIGLPRARPCLKALGRRDAKGGSTDFARLKDAKRRESLQHVPTGGSHAERAISRCALGCQESACYQGIHTPTD